VVIPAGGTLRFAPGGHHLMLVGLARAMKAGDSLPATLVFAGGRRMKVEFAVRLAPPAP
jgi:copper(I)-binding protein